MANLTKLTAEVNIHQSKANRVRGQAAATKAYMDSAAAAIKAYVNDTLTPELDTALGLPGGFPTFLANYSHEVNILNYSNLVVSSNWTAAINAAIASLGGAGTIFFPKGTYTFSQFYLPSLTRLKGEGIGQSILSYAYDAESAYTASNRAITMGDRVTGDFGAGSYYNNLEQITITNAGNTTDGSTGFYATMRYQKWNHVQVSNFQTLFDVFGSWTNSFIHCEFSLCTTLMVTANAANAFSFIGCYLGNCTNGIVSEQIVGFALECCDIEAVTGTFLILSVSSSHNIVFGNGTYVEIAGHLVKQESGQIIGLQFKNMRAIMINAVTPLDNLIYKGDGGTANECVAEGCTFIRYGADTTPFFTLASGQYFTFSDVSARKASDYFPIDIVTAGSYSGGHVIEKTEYPNARNFNGIVKAEGGFVDSTLTALTLLMSDANKKLASLANGTALQMLRMNAAGTAAEFATKPACSAYNNADQAVATGGYVKLAFDSESFDTDTIHDNSTANSRLTAKTAGRYRITLHALFESNATGFRIAMIKLNDTSYPVSAPVNAVNGQPTAIMVEALQGLAVNEFVEAAVYQNSGGDLNVLAESYFAMELIY
jgi:hypothetical protein